FDLSVIRFLLATRFPIPPLPFSILLRVPEIPSPRWICGPKFTLGFLTQPIRLAGSGHYACAIYREPPYKTHMDARGVSGGVSVPRSAMRVIPILIERFSQRFDIRPSTCTGCHHGDKREHFVYSRAPHAPLQILLTIADMFEPAGVRALCGTPNASWRIPDSLGPTPAIPGLRQFHSSTTPPSGA